MFKEIKKAGAIILSADSTDHVALLFRESENDWTFPKGHTEHNETPLETCHREVKEETGLDIEIITALPIYTYTNNKGDKINVHMYLVRAKENKYIPEHSGDMLEWIHVDEISNKISYDTLREYYTSVLPIIRKSF